ncbi:MULTISPECIES: thiamine phosphate synthase [Arcobacteraceae]|uniref:Thiamine-phosphate synthase n=1 Tax=Poseidonibacter parvus TaxID=1850254 RepID=A0A1P8KLI6_9BACT|nr:MULTISPECIES: thiamine phosphate synthase [Arcobacteraceae]APW65433.1 thiamine-phosphate diphosphorylase [Poseidonibacter parvus]
MFNVKEMLGVYFIAGTQDCLHLENSAQENLLYILEEALKNGITCFQFREKGKNCLQNEREIFELAKKAQTLCKRYNVPFFINDNIDLALKLKADGIHIGQDDKEVCEVVKQIQGKLLLGLSINNLEQALQAKDIEGIDYFGVGPIYKTNSKSDAKPSVGLDLIKDIRKQNIKKPLVAIGGIQEAHAKNILECGCNGLAIISAITKSKDMEKTIHNLKN